MLVRDFRKYLAKHLKAIREGEALEVGDMLIGRMPEDTPGYAVPSKDAEVSIKVPKMKVPTEKNLSDHSTNCPCCRKQKK